MESNENFFKIGRLKLTKIEKLVVVEGMLGVA